MAEIIAPNGAYDGVSASVSFHNGVGETDKPNLIDWFKSKGYTVEQAEQTEQTPPEKPDDETGVEDTPPNDDNGNNSGEVEQSEQTEQQTPPEDAPESKARK